MKAIITALFISIFLQGFSQTPEDLQKFENLFMEETHSHNWRSQLKDNPNELSFIFSAFFVIYKELISSQDLDACVFTPSCSVYTIESIKRKGLIAGYFSAIDRLTRCNPVGNKNFPVDPSTGKYYDPVDE